MPPSAPPAEVQNRPQKPYIFYGHRKPTQNRPTVRGGFSVLKISSQPALLKANTPLATRFWHQASFMEFTCLSQGNGLYFPPCHILDICGIRVLLDCPIDLSSLAIFSPITIKSNMVDSENVYSPHENQRNDVNRKTLEAKSLFRAEPLYRTVKNLQLFHVSFIDVVLISSPNGMLGLPFLTQSSDFNAKVYATEAAARIGQLIMEDLVHMHREFKHVYGPRESVAPMWMKWDELDFLTGELRQIILGEGGIKFGGWMPLYSAADVKACMLKVECLKLAEESCYDGTLIIKAFSSGLEIGSCNWTISSPKGNLAWVSNALFSSASAMSFDYRVVEAADMILYSDFSCLNLSSRLDDESSGSANADISSRSGTKSEETLSLEGIDGYLDEIEKLDFICSCFMDSLKDGGSVLIPMGRVGVILQLLDRLSLHLESQDIKVPIYVVSSVAEELLSFTSIIPEWLRQQLQDQFYSGRPLFSYLEMLKVGRLHIFTEIHSYELLKIWQEPCIVFCPHWSLRFGPVVTLLQRWKGDKNSLIVLEEEFDATLGLLPFSPIEMKVLQCSFISELQLQKTKELLKMIQPRHILFPEVLKDQMEHGEACSYYSENMKIQIPYTGKDPIIELENLDVEMSSLKGELVMEQGRYKVCSRQSEEGKY